MTEPQAASQAPLTVPAGAVAEASYDISGFRSLIDFKISLTRGLNVLVGPNGSGKTNFIEFLDFLNDTIAQSAGTAVSKAGGVSRVFSAEQNRKATPHIKARIFGTADIQPFCDDEDHTVFDFEYDIEIRFSKARSTIFIAYESIKFRRLRSLGEHLVAGLAVGAVTVKRTASTINRRPKVEVGPRLTSEAARNPMRPKSKYQFPSLCPVGEASN